MSAASSPPGALRADAARNRELVLDAAARLFGEHGLDVCMHDIASAAGVGVGTVFRRFATKDELIAGVVRQRVRDMCVIALAALERSTDDPWEGFAEFFRAGTDLQARHRGFMEAVCGSHLRDALHGPDHVQLIAMIRELVERAQASGELRTDVSAEDVPMLQGLISRASCMPWAIGVEDVWRRPCAIVLNGLRAGAAGPMLEPQLRSFEELFASK